jgi:putative radical SAM enzyme (TIGR03279 family)
MPKRGIRVVEIESGSIAEEIGLVPGDEITAINGHALPDELALKFHLSDETVNLCVLRQSGEEEYFELGLSDGVGLGIKVEDFRTKTCNNSCLFCFIDQLPPGVRPALKLKDDDYRLSFLHGNYITLTNLPGKELDRIIEQRLSPLYVSVHATEPELRARILGRKKTDDFERKLRKLTDGNIRIHCQIVLMPEINDGHNLEKTVFDLFGFHPGVESVAIVPLGLSSHGSPREKLTPVTSEFCRAVVHQIKPWQDYFRAQTGRNFAYLADEFYLQGKEDLPDSGHYDDFAQIEDGVGMVRTFLDEFEAELSRRHRRPLGGRGTIATGTLFSGILQKSIDRLNRKFGTQLKVCAVENKFMGKSITVAGLLGGQDIAAALSGTDPGDFVLVPSEAISRTQGIFVDDFSLQQLSEIVRKPVYPGGKSAREFFRLLSEIGDH